MIDRAGRIFVAGHSGLVGSAIVRHLTGAGFRNLIVRSRSHLDLRDQPAVHRFFEEQHPDYVFLAAAKVGGILANDTFPADFIYDNLAIQTNVVHAAWKSGVKKLLFLGSACVYPRLAEQPICEDQLLTGALEKTNEAYAIAKIAGIKMVKAYRKQHGFDAISAMPTNLYGPGDNFDLQTSHVIPALIRKFDDATCSGSGEVVVWGTGEPRREFLHVDDMASAAVFLMEKYSGDEIVNVGTGTDISIRELTEMIAQVTGFAGRIVFDHAKPDGTPRRLLDVSRIQKLGWSTSTSLQTGLAETHRWYRQHRSACDGYVEESRT